MTSLVIINPIFFLNFLMKRIYAFNLKIYFRFKKISQPKKTSYYYETKFYSKIK